jgi:hypothetical protein
MAKPTLTWSQPTHRGSSDVRYVAEDPSPSLKHGAYHIRRGEGGSTLVYERWRDEHGGSVPIQHVTLGQHASLAAAKSAAARHHRMAVRAEAKTPAQLEREIRSAMAGHGSPSRGSFIAKIWSTSKRPLLGGVMKTESVPFSHRTDAEDFLDQSIETNVDAGREAAGEVVSSRRPAAVTRHAKTGELVDHLTIKGRQHKGER